MTIDYSVIHGCYRDTRKSTVAHNGLATLPYFLPHSSAGGSTVWSDAIEQGVKSPPASVLPAAVGGDG